VWENFLATERTPCLGTVFSIKLFAKTESVQSSKRINEHKFYLNTGFLPHREQTDPILKIGPLLLRKVLTVNIQNDKTHMKLAYEEREVY
jgi:hypothetical protein